MRGGVPIPRFLIFAKQIHASMLWLILFVLIATLLALLGTLRHFCILEAASESGAGILLEGRNTGACDILLAVFRGAIRLHFCQELDLNLSTTRKEYQAANAPHLPGPSVENWETIRGAALCSTREVILHFKHRGGPDEISLSLFIRSVVLSTLLRVFFGLPATPTSVEDVVWIVEEDRHADNREQGSILSSEFSRLAKPSPSPFGIFALLAVAQKLTLAAICTLERRGGKIPFLRQAKKTLFNPTSPELDITRLVTKVKQSNPPVQFISGRLKFGSLALCGTRGVEFFIPIDLLPHPPCILGPDGHCVSWLHKAALPDKPACGGEDWLIRTTTAILSAIETEIRQANLTVDWDGCGPEAWEDWVLRRLRV